MSLQIELQNNVLIHAVVFIVHRHTWFLSIWIKIACAEKTNHAIQLESTWKIDKAWLAVSLNIFCLYFGLEVLFKCIKRFYLDLPLSVLFLVEKSPVNINCLIDCMSTGSKNIDFSRWLLLAIDGRNTVGPWVIGGGEFESDVSFN